MRNPEPIPDNKSLSNPPETRQQDAPTSTDDKKEHTLAEILRPSELFRYLEDHVFQELLRDVRTLKFEKGTILTGIGNYSVCFVVRGAVDVFIQDEVQSDNRQGKACQKSDEAKWRLLKIVRAEESLLPKSRLLSLLTRRDGDTRDIKDHGGTPASIIGSGINSLRLQKSDGFKIGGVNLMFRATQDVELAIVSTPDFNRLLTRFPSTALHIVQAVIRRFYFVVFPTCRSYFGLYENVLACEKTITRECSLDSSFPFSLEAMVSWLRRIRHSQASASDLGLKKGIVLNDRDLEAPSPIALAQSPDGSIVSLSEAVNEHLNVTLLTIPTSPVRKRRPSDAGLRLETRSSSAEKHDELDSYLRSPSVLSRTEKNPFVRSRSNSFQRSSDDVPLASMFLRQEIIRRIFWALEIADDRTYEPYVANEGRKSKDLRSDFVFAQPSQRSDGRNVPETLLQEYRDNIEIVYFPEGSALAHEGERYPGLYYVLDGNLRAQISVSKSDDSDEEIDKVCNAAFSVGVGGLIGYSGLLANNRALFEITAVSDSYVGFLTRAKVQEIIARYPKSVFAMGERLLDVLPSLVKLVDFAVDWTQYGAGQAVSYKGEHSDAIHVLLNGRLRTTEVNPDTGEELIKEIGKDESVGTLDMYQRRARLPTSIAIRRSELARIQLSSYKSLSFIQPSIAFALSKVIAASAFTSMSNATSRADNRNTSRRTIAVLPLSNEVPVEQFVKRLTNAITATGIKLPGNMAMLDSTTVLSSLGGNVFDKVGNLRLENYFTMLEDALEVIFCVGDMSANSTWTRMCISHADVIVLLGMADNSPSLTEMESVILQVGVVAQTELVLLHNKGKTCPPGLTSLWLEKRKWITGGHHHVRLEIFNPQPPSGSPTPLLRQDADLDRLARRLFGKSIALVLGGGGARGVAHLGFIKALEEAGIPIDIIGGTSMGSTIGGVYARELNFPTTFTELKKFCENARYWKFYKDITYPYLSKTSGSLFHKLIYEQFGELHIEDMWLEYYCSVTNITKNGIAQSQTQGRAGDSIGASMSYAGAVPPTCMNGDMLLDGCYSGNLPVRRARQLGADTIFIVDVSTLTDYTPQHYGNVLSGWKILCDRWNPFRKEESPGPPSHSELIERLTQATSLNELEATKNLPGCHYISIPVTNYRGEDFARFDEIFETGYRFTKSWFKEMEVAGKFPELATRGTGVGKE